VSIRFSRNFTYNEFVRSRVARENGIDNTPKLQHVIYGVAHSHLILQPLRNHLKRPIVISSWYRCPQLNKEVGGVSNSDHMKGPATDLRVRGMVPADIIEAIQELELPFHQAIDEGFYNDKGEWISWAHVSSVPDFSLEPRFEDLIARGERDNPDFTRAVRTS